MRSRSRAGFGGSESGIRGGNGVASRGSRLPLGPDGALGESHAARFPGGSGWTSGTPWSNRTSQEGGAGARGEVGNELSRRPSAASAPAEPAPAGPRGAAEGRAGQSGVPFLPGGAGGRSGGEEHPRPAWLVEEDENVWFEGLPPLAPPVIRPERSGRAGTVDLQ